MTISSYVFDKPKDVYFSTEDDNFIVGDSPVTLDVNTTLGKNSTNGYIINDGPGNFTVNLSVDGAVFQDDITMKIGETYSLDDLDVDSIKITWVANSAYRVFAV